MPARQRTVRRAAGSTVTVLDVVFVVDAQSRDPDVAHVRRMEIEAAIDAGASIGLLALQRRDRAPLRGFDPWIRTRIDGGALSWVTLRDQARCRSAVVVDLADFRYLPPAPSALRPDVVLVLPPLRRSPDKVAQGRCAATLRSYFQAPVRFLSIFATPEQMAYWPMVPARRIGEKPRLGPISVGTAAVRYGRRTHPADNPPEENQGIWTPPPWSSLPPHSDPGEDATANAQSCTEGGSDVSDFYVLDGSAAESFAELSRAAALLARGIVVAAPLALEPVLAEGATYPDSDDHAALVSSLSKDHRAYRRHSRAALRAARTRFSTVLWRQRFEGYLPAPCRESQSPPPASPFLGSPSPGRRACVLMISSNGVGLGHLTRLIAVARKLPQHIEPRFLTLSEGAEIAARMGYPVDYLPSFRRLRLEPVSWNRFFARRLVHHVRSFSPSAAIFDGNWPYGGLLDVMTAAPEVRWLWIRRGLWRRGRDLVALEQSRRFDAIFEPRDWSENEDVGPTTSFREDAITVDPPRILDLDGILARENARRHYSVGPDELCVAIQLGPGTNFSFARIRSALLADLAGRARVRVIQLESPISGDDPRTTDRSVQAASEFPSVRFAMAYDLLICGAGYNSFHESFWLGIPTVFVPNEAPDMDDQLLRARFAETTGFSLTLRAHDLRQVGAVLDAALARGFRERASAARRCAPNGAAEIARVVDEIVSSADAGRSLANAINRI